MITKELTDYIKSQTEKGVPRDAILNILIANGWEAVDVNQAFSEIAKSANPAPNNILTQNPVSLSDNSSTEKKFETNLIQSDSVTAQPKAEAINHIEPVNQAQVSGLSEPNIVQQVHPMITPNMNSSSNTASMGQVSLAQSTQNLVTISTQNSQPQTIEQNPESQKSKLALFILLVLIVLAGAGFAYAYFTGILISPEKISKQAFESMQSATSVTFDLTANVETISSNDNYQGLSMLGFGKSSSVTFKGSSDFSDSSSPKFDANVKIGSGAFNLIFDFRYLDKKIYGKLVELPSMIPFLGSVEEYKNKWYSMDISLENETLKSASGLSSFGFDPDTIANLPPESMAELESIVNNASLIKIIEKLPSKEINGAKTIHASFDLDKEGIKKYLTDLTNFVKKIGKNDSEMSAFDLTSSQDVLDNINNFKGEFWIGEKDKLLYKFSLNFNLNESDNLSYKINLVGIFNEWNVPKGIMAPTPVISIEEMMKSTFNQEVPQDKDSMYKSNLSMIRGNSEMYFDDHAQSYLGFCKMLTAAKVNTSADFTCKDSKTKYSAGEILSDGRFWCVDSSGFEGAVSRAITTTSCPK